MQYDDFLDRNQLKVYAKTMNARAKAHNKQGRVDADDLQTRIFASGGQCEWCATSLVKADFEIDHIISLSEGGENTPDNLAIACPACNRAKASKHPARFAQEIFSRTGNETSLLRKLLTKHDLELRVQLSLFDAPDDTTQIILPHDDDDTTDDVPPYVW